VFEPLVGANVKELLINVIISVNTEHISRLRVAATRFATFDLIVQSVAFKARGRRVTSMRISGPFFMLRIARFFPSKCKNYIDYVETVCIL